MTRSKWAASCRRSRWRNPAVEWTAVAVYSHCRAGVARETAPAAQRPHVMEPKITYPRWFHSLRGCVIGVAAGCAATTLAYESQLIPVGDVLWKQMLLPLAINLVPWLVLAPFEIYFSVRRYRAIRREKDARAAAAA